MIRNLKVLGLAIGVVLALSAVMASTSTAAQFTASSYPATIEGWNFKGGEVFTLEGGKIECDSEFVSHSLSAASSTLTVTPTYEFCDAFGFIEATVDTEECTYVFHATEGSAGVYKSHVDVVCPFGQSIKVTASTCKVEINPQNGLTTVKTTNLGGGTVTVQPEVSSIHYTVTQDGFLCPFGGTGSKSDGKYTGDVEVSRVGGGSISVS